MTDPAIVAVLRTLAATRDPVTLAQLVVWTGLQRKHLTEVLDALDRSGAIVVRHESFARSGWTLPDGCRAALAAVGVGP